MHHPPLSLFTVFCLSLLFLHCQQEDDQISGSTAVERTGQIIELPEIITENATLSSGNTYVLNGLVTVTNGATLSIEPCVVVKAHHGATGLVIDTGSRIDATGTSDCPIIFTSTDDQLEPGMIESPNIDPETNGLWSGIFLLGKAPVSIFDNGQNSIMSLLPELTPLSFGGTTSDDNSGRMRYISIRHTGFEISPFETPAGLNLGGVGNGTTINHIELVGSKDDGIKIFGGTVSASSILVSNFTDDGIDCDLGFSGSIDNIIGIGGTNCRSALELDGGEGQDNPMYFIRNISFKGSMNGEEYIDFQHSVNCFIENAAFFGFDEQSNVILDDDVDAANWMETFIDVENIQFRTSHLNTGNTSVETIFTDLGPDGNNAFQDRIPDAQVVSVFTTGADKTAFEGWTIASLSGELSDF